MPTDPCKGVTCGDGRCVPVDGSPACLCASGFSAQGLTCVAIPREDPCASNPCASLSNSLCQVRSGSVSCVCPSTRVEVNGSCVVRTACLPNPCTQPRRTTCEVVGAAANCRCDPGYAPESDGCAAVPVWNCAAQHVDGDSAEPDECPVLAKPLPIDSDEARTILPAGDHDWLELRITPRHAFTVTANATSIPLLLEVFDRAGLTLLASDNRGLLHAEVTFVAPAGQHVMVRVRSVRGSAFGNYQVRYREVGIDDYVNTTADAITLVAGAAAFAGSVQYAGDVDVVWLETPRLTAMRLSFLEGGSPDVQLEVARVDGGTRVLNPGESIVVTTPTTERLSLTARGRTSRSRGDYQLNLKSLGPDDHSDEPVFGTPLASDNVPVSGTMDRANDIDSFRVEQLVGRIYRARWPAPRSTWPWLYVSVLLPGGAESYNSHGATGLVWQADQSLPATVRMSNAYSIAVEDLGFDDHSDTVTAATPVTVNMPVAGRLELLTDVDTFAFTGVANHVFQVSAAPTTTGIGTPSLRVRLLDSVGTVLSEEARVAGALSIANGTYNAQVLQQSYFALNDLQRYTVTVRDLGAEDHGDTAASGTPLPLGTSVSAVVGYLHDVDVFTFSAVAGQIYAVSLTNSSVRVEIRDASNRLVTSSRSSVTSFLASSSGTFSIAASGDYSSNTLAYTVAVTDRGVDDHANTVTGATALALGSSLSGDIQYQDDLDVFSVTPVAGHHHRAKCTGTTEPCVVVVLDAVGTLLNAAYGNGTTSFQTPVGATAVFVRVSSTSESARYSILTVDLGADDFGDTKADGASLVVDAAATSGVLGIATDVDAFLISANAGDIINVSCTAVTGSPCSIKIFNPQGGEIVSSPSYASRSTGFLAATAGVYLLELRDITSATTAATYRVRAVRTSDDFTAPTPLSRGTRINGSINYVGDTDVFSFAATQGMAVTLNISAGGRLRVTSPTGRLEALVYSNFAETFSPTETGPYLLTVVPSASYNEVTAYTLSVQ